MVQYVRELHYSLIPIIPNLSMHLAFEGSFPLLHQTHALANSIVLRVRYTCIETDGPYLPAIYFAF